MMKGTEGHYREDIDGLRGLAVIAIVLFHLSVVVFCSWST
jgi:peptidoglycan/LPS O-acetylase OafA/YrhL